MSDSKPTLDRSRLSGFIMLREGEARPQQFDTRPHFFLKVGREDAEGRFSLLVATIVSRIPRHVHQNTNESFYLLEGELEVEFGGKKFHATPGTYMYLPSRVPHAVTPLGERTPRVVQISSPGGFEVFAEAQIRTQVANRGPEAAHRDFSSPEFVEMAREHGFFLVSDEEMGEFLKSVEY